jgi:hypothetical protein
MVLAAQAQDAVVLSPDSSGCARVGTGPPSAEATGGVEDGRNLLERWCSSKSEDMEMRVMSHGLALRHISRFLFLWALHM